MNKFFALLLAASFSLAPVFADNMSGGGGGSGSGTVTNFTAGNASPLFTTSVGTPSSTPALTFTISNAGAHTYYGNNTGSSAAGAFVAIVDGDLPTTLNGHTLSGSTLFSGNHSPSTAGGQTVGSAALPFSSVYVGASATNNANVTGTFTGARTCTIVDANSNTSVPSTAGAHQFASAFSSGGVFTWTQPAFTDVSGTATAAQLPATAVNSTGNLSPLFTSSITTQALSFALSNAAAHSWLGNNTGSAAAPGYQTIGAADLPSTTVNSTGALSPLFTSSISAQALSFTQSTSAANTVFANATGSAANPTFVQGTTNGTYLGMSGGTLGFTTPAGSAFGGNGADGAINLTSGGTWSGPIQKNATTFALPSGQTLTLNTASPVIINATSTLSISGTLTCTAGSGGAGGSGGTGTASTGWAGAGPGGGMPCAMYSTVGGGGGGGSGSYGGRGGSATATNIGAPGGNGYYSSLIGGSGGAGGNSGAATSIGGAGGGGGMCLVLCSVGALTTASTAVITNNGAAGGNGTVATSAGGGGGGGGGHLWLISQTSVNTAASGTITEAGGAGGNMYAGSTAGGGGGGSGGRLFLWSPSNTNSSTNAFTAGAASSGNTCNGEAGQAGSATSISGTPNQPLLVFMGIRLPHDIAEARTFGEGNRVIARHEAEARARGENVVYINQRELAREYARGDLNLYAKALTPGFDSQEPTCLDNDALEALQNVS